jgi:hypothetical protein
MKDIQKRFEDAICFYWQTRSIQTTRQRAGQRVDAGLRSAVTGGKQMEAMEKLIESILIDAGIPKEFIHRRTAVELPGYYRPEKKWDLVVVAEDKLIAALEFKSQVGPSFGNNFNNRTEEAVGTALDLWTGFRERAFSQDFRPWLGYLFLLEDSERSQSPVRLREPHFPVDRVFRKTSYAQRYQIFCQRLILERLYDAACFVTSTNDPTSPLISQPDSSLTFQRFVASLLGKVHEFLQV